MIDNKIAITEAEPARQKRKIRDKAEESTKLKRK